MSPFALLAEFLLIFFGLPVGYRLLPIRIPALPVLWLVSTYAWWQLWRDPTFDRKLLWNAAALPQYLPGMLAIFAAGACLIWWGVHRWRPHLEWDLVRRNRFFWALVVVLYPLLSVYPQGVLYRAFLFHRYAALFPTPWAMVSASAVAFGFAHLVFRSKLAAALTFAGGILFATRYLQTRSLAASCLEHALYGEWLFTVGLGGYLYTGTISAVGSVLRR